MCDNMAQFRLILYSGKLSTIETEDIDPSLKLLIAVKTEKERVRLGTVTKAKLGRSEICYLARKLVCDFRARKTSCTEF